MIGFEVRNNLHNVSVKAKSIVASVFSAKQTSVAEDISKSRIRKVGLMAFALVGLATPGAALMTLGTVSTVQAATIDTTPSWNGSTEISSFGEPDTATYGQTFTVGTDNIINSFTFYLKNNPGVDFAGYIAAWDGTKAQGPILYNSGVRSTGAGGGFQEFAFNTGGIALTSGAQYVAFLSASNFFDGNFATTTLGYLGQDVYPGGGFVFLNNGSDFSQLTTTAWQTFIGDGVDDTAFKASFNAQPVPEPLTILGTMTAAGLGVAMRRKQKQQQKATTKVG
ncbi:PEP-CTERM sorting domain-containing protein [Fortiea contorta]|uniref:PEP-CTERM sorting domain-containing protein n=1 Tax=Fortiea contorta TaxID=1892405 RepID=UPI00034922FA|nr:PEP-CTERM sorting domain-containing protein [Fortiea contorta]